MSDLGKYKAKLAAEGFSLVEGRGISPAGDSALLFKLSHSDGRKAVAWVTDSALQLVRGRPEVRDMLVLAQLQNARKAAQAGSAHDDHSASGNPAK